MGLFELREQFVFKAVYMSEIWIVAPSVSNLKPEISGTPAGRPRIGKSFLFAVLLERAGERQHFDSVGVMSCHSREASLIPKLYTYVPGET